MILETAFRVLGGIKSRLGGVVGENEFETVLSGVNGWTDGVVLVVLVVEKRTLNRGTLVYEVDVLAVQVVWVELDQHVL